MGIEEIDTTPRAEVTQAVEDAIAAVKARVRADAARIIVRVAQPFEAGVEFEALISMTTDLIGVMWQDWREKVFYPAFDYRSLVLDTFDALENTKKVSVDDNGVVRAIKTTRPGGRSKAAR